MSSAHTRRSFMTTSVTATASLGLASIFQSPLLQAAEEAGDPTILGQGAHRFRRDTEWTLKAAEKPVPVADCHEIVRTKSGNLIFCTTHTQNNLIEFSPDGKVVKTFGSTYPGAHGLTLVNENGAEFLWLTDTKRRIVVKMDLNGKEILTLGWPEQSGKYTNAAQFCPTETAVNPNNGDIYVADGYGKNWLMHYSASGELKGCYKHDGFNCIHGVAYDGRDPKNPKLLVTSRVANKLFVLSLDGQKIEELHFPGAWICRPVIHGDHVYFAVINSGRLAWGSDFRGFVMVLNKNNQPVSLIGGLPPMTGGAAESALYRNIDPKPFLNCHDVCLDEEGNLYIAHWASNQTYPYKLKPV
jgi:peptidylamidoglycolate lyase